MAIIVKNLDRPDEAFDYGDAGTGAYTIVADSMISRSILHPGWSWDQHVKPFTDGDESCPLTHYEYIVSGHIRYLSDDGEEVTAGPGDHLWIGPGHRAWVVGDEPCVSIDFEIGEPDDDEGDDE